MQQLLDELPAVKTEGTLKHAVDTAINASSAVLTATLSYTAIGQALSDAEEAYLGQAVLKGGGIYQYYMMVVYDDVRVFDIVKYEASSIKVGKQIDPLRSSLAVNISSGLTELLRAHSLGITSALNASNVATNDGLYALMKSFAEGLDDIRTRYDGTSRDTDIQNEIGTFIGNFVVDLSNITSVQAFNAAVSVFISNRLKTIFGYSPLELPLIDPDKGDTENPDPSKPGDGTPDDPNHSGSGGDGKTEYGSDDEVWVPGRGYMKYGDIIDEYYALINQYLHSEELTEEQKSMIRAYYDILFGSGRNP